MNGDELKSNITRGAGIALGWAAGRYHLSTDTIGLIMSDVSYAGAVVAFGYGLFSHWNMKKVPETAKVIGAAAVLILAIGMFSGARAADLRPAPVFTKAPVATVPVCTVSSCNGWFVGGSIANSGGNFDVVGTGLTGIAQNGFGVGSQAGYEFWNGQIYAAALVRVSYDTSLNSSGMGISDRLTWGGIIRLGYSLASAAGIATTTSTAQPTLPQQLMASLMTPYINLGEVSRHNQAALVSGAGIEALIANNWTINADYYHYTYDQGGSAGTTGLPVSQQADNEFVLSINRHFGSSGL